MMDCDMELEAEMNPSLSTLFLVMVFYSSSRNHNLDTKLKLQQLTLLFHVLYWKHNSTIFKIIVECS